MAYSVLPLAPAEWGFCLYEPISSINNFKSACCCAGRPEGCALKKSDCYEAAEHAAGDSTTPGSGVGLGGLTKVSWFEPCAWPAWLGTQAPSPIGSPAGSLPPPTKPRAPRRPTRPRPPHSRPEPEFPAAKPTDSPRTEPLSCLEAQPRLRSPDRRKHSCTKNESCPQSLNTNPPRQRRVRGWRVASVLRAKSLVVVCAYRPQNLEAGKQVESGWALLPTTSQRAAPPASSF